MIKGIIVAALCLLSTTSTAEIYRCEIDGRKVFQPQPCKGVESERVSISVPSSATATKNISQKDNSDFFEKRRQRWAAEEVRLNARAKAAREARERRALLKERIGQRKVAIGMTKSDVIASWGRADDINSSVSSRGRSEQWIYERGDFSRQYVHFDNGKVSYISSN